MKAEKTTITEKVVTEVQTEAVVLTLSMEEAGFLLDLTGHIGGDPAHTRRIHADRLRVALREAGVRGVSNSDVCSVNRSIYFTERKANG